jgi:DnaJ-class molecular chaperone
MPRDYYEVLGIGRKATPKEVQAAYRKLARRWHPDVNREAGAEAKFKEVSEAYEVLRDEEKRALYDRFGHDYAAARHGTAGDEGFVDMGGHFGVDLGGLFGNLFGVGGMGGVQPGRPPGDVEQTVEVTLEEVDSGTKRTLAYRVADACETCKGTGQVMARGGPAPCPACSGRGVVEGQRRIEVKVPAGCEGAKKLRVPGGGSRGSNGRRGDLFVAVRVLPHPTFRRVGADTEVELEVPFPIAALGGSVKVPTPRGSASVSVPSGTQSGQVLRLKGQGVTKLGGDRGDLRVRVRVSVPRTLSDRQRELIRQLASEEVS